MKFIIGLGNPGSEYVGTKHNIGFAVVKELAKSAGIKVTKRLHFSLLGRGKIGGQDVTLVIPQTFMNMSGNAVAELIRREVRDASDILVVCDDINLELGKIRMKKRGSSGGHKGLESIINITGMDEFSRLRVGIATGVHEGDITGYVLSPFKRKETRNAAHSVFLARDAVICMVEEGIDKAMAKFNKKRVGTS